MLYPWHCNNDISWILVPSIDYAIYKPSHPSTRLALVSSAQCRLSSAALQLWLTAHLSRLIWLSRFLTQLPCNSSPVKTYLVIAVFETSSLQRIVITWTEALISAAWHTLNDGNGHASSFSDLPACIVWTVCNGHRISLVLRCRLRVGPQQQFIRQRYTWCRSASYLILFAQVWSETESSWTLYENLELKPVNSKPLQPPEAHYFSRWNCTRRHWDRTTDSPLVCSCLDGPRPVQLEAACERHHESIPTWRNCELRRAVHRGASCRGASC